MIGILKFVAGALVTSALAVGAFSGLGHGTAFIDDLESEATSALGNAGGFGVTLAFVREPSLQRVAVLSGNAEAPTRARLLTAIRAVPGVRDARWADGGAGSEQGETP